MCECLPYSRSERPPAGSWARSPEPDNWNVIGQVSTPLKELVFYPGFSFRIRTARNSKNLVVDDFNKVEIYGQFGTRKIFSIDLSYVDLEKVEFIRGTDQGKVRARVAQREFQENKHSKLFKFIGTMIPNTSKQRIDW